MDNNKKPDLKISGSGSSGGGIFDQVKISGSGTVTGNVECNEFDTSGSSRVIGNVTADIFKTSGSSKVSGNLTSNEIKTSGMTNIEGNVEAKLIKTSGSCRIGGNALANDINTSGSINILGGVKVKNFNTSGGAKIGKGVHGESIDFSGAIKVFEDCEAEVFKAKGSFDIGGLLNAGDISIEIYGSCKVKEIGGENIEVKKGTATFFFIQKIMSYFSDTFNYLTTDIIEGDNICLENTIAKVVRGNNITIGADCKIDLIEYKDKINISDKSTVKEQKLYTHPKL